MKEARAHGVHRFFPGVACAAGHVAERYTSDGRCVVCALDIGRKKYASHPERYRKAARKWNARYPETAAAVRKAWRTSHPDRHKQSYERWREEHRDQYRATSRAWTKNNPGKNAAKTRNRKARVLAAAGSHTAEDVANILRAQRGKCAYCKITLKKRWHADHIIALVRGGSNDRRNIQVLCPTCNVRKQAKDPIEYARSVGFLL